MDLELSRLGRVDGHLKVSGQAVYTGDLHFPDMLHTEVVRSPYSHARITAIHTAAAMALPGVHAVLTGADSPYGPYGSRVRDTLALARDVVRYSGERVVAVAAETPEIARAAAALIEVEYEPLPAVLDPAAALEADAPRVHEEPWRYSGALVTPDDHPNLQSRTVWSGGGDVEAALAASDRVFIHTFRTQTRHQGYLETHVCVARASETDIDIWASNKGPFNVRSRIVAWTGLPKERVHVHPVLIGGDFGGKGDLGDIPVCILLAQRTGRAVRMRMRYAEDLMAANPRHSSTIEIRLGVDRQNRMTALDVKALFDGGAYAGYKPKGFLGGVADAAGSYRIPAARVESLIAYTHTLPKGHMRSPGAAQAVFAMESMVDKVARELGIDPVEFRRHNMLRQGDTSALGEHWLEIRSNEVMGAALAALAKATPLPPAPPDAPPGGDWVTGTGVGLYNTHTLTGETEVALQPQLDGTLDVWVGLTDQGGGQFTMARNAVCRYLNLPVDLVRVRQADTDGLAIDSGTGGGWSTATVSEALSRACHKLRLRVSEVLGERGQALAAGHADGADSRGTFAAFAATTGSERVTAYLNYREEAHEHVTSFCLQIVRVWVDRSSGQVVVADIITALDVADILNPASHMVQIEGGIAMSYGEALLEDLTMEDGKVSAANLGDYKLPSIRDLPPMQVILVEGSKGMGEQNVKTIGEVSSVAVAPAVANAVAAAAGVRIDSMPITAEKVYFALHPEEAGQ